MVSKVETFERERDELRVQAAPQPSSEAPTIRVMTETPEAQRPAEGLWQRFRRAIAGE